MYINHDGFNGMLLDELLSNLEEYARKVKEERNNLRNSISYEIIVKDILKAIDKHLKLQKDYKDITY